MDKILKIFMGGFIASCSLLIACSDNGVANGTVTDPNANVDQDKNTIAINSSASESPSGQLPPEHDIVIEVSSSSVVFPDTVPSVDPMDVPHTPLDTASRIDSCQNDLGENICPGKLLDGEGDVFYESAHCLVKVVDSDTGYRVGVQFTAGAEFIEMSESILYYEDPEMDNEYVKTMATHLTENRWDLCNDLLDDFESYVVPHADSLEILGISGVYGHWDRNGCDNGTVSRIWYEYYLPEGIRDQLSQKAEQFKNDCDRWENEIK